MLRSGLFVNFSGILITVVISSASYSSDPFPRPSDSFRNEPDFLRDNRDHNDSSTLAPFQNNLSSPLLLRHLLLNPPHHHLFLNAEFRIRSSACLNDALLREQHNFLYKKSRMYK